MTGADEPTTVLENDKAPTELRSRRDTRRRVQRRRRRVGGAVAGALIVVIALVGSSGGSGIPAKVSIAGVDVGGLSKDAARARIAEHGTTVLAGRVSISTSEPGFVADVPAARIASEPLLDEAIQAAGDSRGRIGSTLARIGLTGRKNIPLRFTIRRGAVDTLIANAHAKVGRAPVSAVVAVKGTEVVITPAKPGRAIDRADVTAGLATLPSSFEVPVRVAQPPGDDSDAERAKQLALRILARSHEITWSTNSALLVPRVTRKALRFPLDKDTINVALDPEALRSALSKPLGINERPPADARLEIRGNRVAVIPAKLGRRLNGRALSAALVAAPDAPTVAAKVATSKPAFTTEEAKALGIKEKVSEFTTPYQCCQARVTNIQRAAQILDGTIIPAGNRFSLNDRLGERTAARGFVPAPQIAAGELVEGIGGGVSQVATTTYNAAFFAGLELIAHTPHEFYISRYPMGREATISWRTPDLVFRNDWDAAILVSARAGSNGITVAFYSSKLGRRVETETSQPANRTEPKTIERQNPDLPPGTRTVIQASGPRGFSISYTRKVYKGSTVKRDERFTWTYRPENEIVELGPPKPDAPPDDDETGTSTSPTTTAPTPPATTGETPPPTP